LRGAPRIRSDGNGNAAALLQCLSYLAAIPRISLVIAGAARALIQHASRPSQRSQHSRAPLVECRYLSLR
jgi:hypothetical protein